MATRSTAFYDPSDEYDPLNLPEVESAPWTIVCQELDVFEFRHSDGRGGWAEWSEEGKLIISDGEEQEELTSLIATTMPMEATP